MEEYVGKICPVCKQELTAEDKVKVCPDCGIPHHEACWEVNAGCSTFGCLQQGTAEKTNPTEKCAKCGAELAEGHEFCPKCGTPKDVAGKNICSKCGAELAEGQVFCPKCGQKVGSAVDEGKATDTKKDYNESTGKKKGKKKLLPIILAVIAVIAASVGFFVFKNVREKAIDDYKDKALTFYVMVLSDAAKLEDIGNDEVGYWYDYIYNDSYSSIESAVLMAQIDNSGAMDTVEKNYSEIVSLYRDLLEVPKGAPDELAELKDAVKDTYDAYADFYDTVMNVTGSYKSFSEAFHDTDNAMSKAIKKLGDLVD